ncbi:MAG: class I SAM-dependent methyltransferase [Gammaproteobacteria bacterium]|nr:class I SAM-dependent methyltransferase [Gammaproteobacteria bacterium]
MPEPSARYIELLEQYRKLHHEGDAAQGLPGAKMFPGTALFPQAPRIAQLIAETHTETLLDYGCGKGLQYEVAYDAPDGKHWTSVQHYWGIQSIRCYDPAYLPHSQKPAGQFDGVISTDVLEHCPEEDLPWILETLFTYARKFVFVNAACYPAVKNLPNGENAHSTVKPPQWWGDLFVKVAARFPNTIGEIQIQQVRQIDKLQHVDNIVISNSRTSK